jgi:hypothetical protein
MEALRADEHFKVYAPAEALAQDGHHNATEIDPTDGAAIEARASE